MGTMLSKAYLKNGIGILILLGTVHQAFGQPRDNPIERARYHMELGQDAFSAKEYQQATEHFIDAYAASPFPAFLYNAGHAAEAGGDTNTAAEFFRRYLDEEPNAPDGADVELRIRTLLADAPTRPETGESAPGVPTVDITEREMKSLISVRTNPPDAHIRILDENGNEITAFEGPAAQTVTAGSYTIEASHDEFRTVHTNLHVTPGQVYIVVVEMSQGAFLGFVQIKTDAPGASVFVDDKTLGSVGTTPWGNVLPSGSHTIWIEKPGFKSVQREIQVEIGDKLEIDLEMERLPFGILLLKSNIDGAQVIVDDSPKGQTSSASPFTHQLSAGTHKVTVTAPGMKDYSTEVPISPGQTSKLLVRLNPKPSRTSGWVSAGVAAALFTYGTVAGVKSYNMYKDLEGEKNSGTLSDGDPRVLHGFLWGLSADVAFGLGALVTGLSVYYFLRDPLPPSEGKLYDPIDFDSNPGQANDVIPLSQHLRGPQLVVTPLVSKSSAGLGLALHF